MKPEPKSETELLDRARDIAGVSFKELADEANLTVPPDLRRDKGWVGQLLEWHLGAIAGSKPQQDFEQLGIELKTDPDQLYGQTFGNHLCLCRTIDGSTRTDLGNQSRT